MDSIKVFGHKSPDTDTVCSAIVFAWFLKEVRGKEAVAFRLGELNKETAFVLEKWGVPVPEKLGDLVAGEKVAIVDTCNPEELPETLSTVDIVEVVDHHKLSGLMTASPLAVTMRPYACTATILVEMTKQAGKEMPAQMKQLALSCIISDTLLFRSPTTTPFDKQIAEQLAMELGVSADQIANEMFERKSDLTGMSAKDILYADSKVFEMKGKKARVSTLETTNPANALSMKTAILAEMQSAITTEGIDDIFFFVVDILKEEATCVMSTESAKVWVSNAFGVAVTEDTVLLPGVVSRKKQIVPSLSK